MVSLYFCLFGYIYAATIDLVATALATSYFASLLRCVGCQELVAKWKVTARQLIMQYNRGGIWAAMIVAPHIY